MGSVRMEAFTLLILLVKIVIEQCLVLTLERINGMLVSLLIHGSAGKGVGKKQELPHLTSEQTIHLFGIASEHFSSRSERLLKPQEIH